LTEIAKTQIGGFVRDFSRVVEGKNAKRSGNVRSVEGIDPGLEAGRSGRSYWVWILILE
jgi:hypothetical protein